MNALKHGLRATAPQSFEALEKEVGVTFPEILDKMRTQFWPRDPLEDELVIRIARCLWRLALASNMEKREIERFPGLRRPGTSYEQVMKFERLVDIHLHRAINTLLRKREVEKIFNSANEMPPRSL